MTIAYMAKSKRNITEEDLAAAKELRRLWEELQEKTGAKGKRITEGDFVKDLDISQSMFNQLKSGNTTWSTDHVLMMSHLFKVPPTNFKKVKYLDYVPSPKRESASFIDIEKDHFWETILHCYPGLTTGHKDALAYLANKLHSIDRPNDKRSSPPGSNSHLNNGSSKKAAAKQHTEESKR